MSAFVHTLSERAHAHGAELGYRKKIHLQIDHGIAHANLELQLVTLGRLSIVHAGREGHEGSTEDDLRHHVVSTFKKLQFCNSYCSKIFNFFKYC